jgi:hypothetical protein
MKVIARDTTELLNQLYGDEEDYSYIKEENVPEIIDEYIEYLENIYTNENFVDNGYLGDIENLLCLFKNIDWRDNDK